MEQLLWNGVIAILNQSSNIGVPSRDNPIEWRVNTFELLQSLGQVAPETLADISFCLNKSA